MKILSVAATREVDRAATEDYGIPSLVLMENAAVGLADAVGERFPTAEAVTIFCGPGNNGGDGFALGRHLAIRGYDVRLFLVAGGRQPSDDAETQLAICRKQGLAIVEVGADDPLDDALAAAREGDLVVDALFGTGLGRPLAGQYAELVARLNELPVPRLAVDLPSGLNGDRADVFGPALTAQVTVTFAAPKPAQVFPPAADLVGELVVADLGVPRKLIEDAAGDLHLLLAEELAGALPPRSADSHKGDYGHVLIVAGSPGKSGAAVLAARAAVRAGAGLVTAAVPASLLVAVDTGSVESMTVPLTAGKDGEIAAAAVEELRAAAAGKDIVALGPGLGQREETAAAIRAFVAACPLPLVLDADGVNAFAGRAGEIARRREGAPTVLTPHPGELARLLDVSVGEVQGDRVAAARRAAAECRALVVLKGHLSLVATPQGAVYVSPPGNAGMATGGSGDVLTGALAALLAQVDDPLTAVQLAVFAHGVAGDLVAERSGEVGLAAGDLVEALPAALRRLAAGRSGR
jgi:ADP-dependent NAD(P)H-hydrate dehydratase / NAD(P)H-hydrate epimerase